MPGVAKPKRPDPSKNLLFYGDCLDVLGEWIDDESVDLIYLDPPFNSTSTPGSSPSSTADLRVIVWRENV